MNLRFFLSWYKLLYFAICQLLVFTFCLAQPIYTQKDIEICNSKFQLALQQNLSLRPINEVIITIAKSFIGTEYQPYTLEKGNNEQLVVNLTGLDCYTFLESSIVIARCIKKNKYTFDEFLKELENIRYRDGKLKDYPSRLHYFSDWIYDMSKRKIGEDITKRIGGIPYKKKINYMSMHSELYPKLKSNKNYFDQIIEIENEISNREYYYIPQNKIHRVENKIKEGDIIGITTNIEGLDISHTGIAIKESNGRIHLLHAPNVGQKVQITKLPLADYIKANSKHTGIMVLRILD
ncbi:MAG: DUF1460 domain-containing protein [Melioribacter sp.]|nr:DUF1460 domain-containing protein [Melioribacter sp.]